MAKEQRISVRIPAGQNHLKRRIAKAASIIGVSETALVLAALNATCDFIEEEWRPNVSGPIIKRMMKQLIASQRRSARE